MNQKTIKTELEKEAIIAEYLTSETTYRKLDQKYNVDFRIIHSWVTKFQGKALQKPKRKPQTGQSPPKPEELLPTDVKRLQEELRRVKLHNELLNAIIDIAEDQLKIDIRKKSGTKR